MSGNTTAIVLSYLRPQNIPRVLSGILESHEVSSVIVSNNNPDVKFPEIIPDHCVKTISQSIHSPAAMRFFIAAETNAETFICIDDDLFLSGEQIDMLINYLHIDPSTPHGGPWGQKLVLNDDGGFLLKGWFYPNFEVDVLNRVYAFTKEHVIRYMEITKNIGYPTVRDAGPWDDIILSHCGCKRPKAHDLGSWESCETSNNSSVALWMKPGFRESRLEIFWRLKEFDELRF